MKYVSLFGIFLFLLGGCAAVDGFNLLTGTMVIGGLLLTWFGSQFWDFEDVKKGHHLLWRVTWCPVNK